MTHAPRTTSRESKEYIGNLNSFTSVSTAGAYFAVGATIAEGTESYNRLGRNARLTSFRIFGCLDGGQVNAITDDSHNTFRVCLIQGVVGIAPTIGVGDYIDPRNSPGVLRVLYDDIISLSTPGADSTGYLVATKQWKAQCKLPNIPMVWSGSAGNTVKGTEIYLYMVSDSAAVANPGFTNGSFVVGFDDE